MSSCLTRFISCITSVLLVLLGTIAIAVPAHAEVGLRVQPHPIEAPIDAFVRVTEGGEPVAGLTPADFSVTLDGAPVEYALTLPPNQDSAQKVSVVIVMRQSQAGPEGDFSPLIDQLDVGDFVSVVKFAAVFDNPRLGGLWVLPFTEIDDGPGSAQILSFIQESHNLTAIGGRFFFDGLMEGMSQFEMASATLPEGPKAIVTTACCGGPRFSLSEVVARANAGGVSIFNMYNTGLATYPDVDAEQKALARSTGGIHVRGRNAIASMGSWLRDGYRVTIPHAAIGDCGWHKLGITVGGESRSASFSRCDSTPEPFVLRDIYDADVSKRVRARVVITGIETPAQVRVSGGQYSVGCTTTYTTEPGRVRPGQAICVRHITAASGGQEVATFLVVGGVSEWFTSTTALP